MDDDKLEIARSLIPNFERLSADEKWRALIDHVPVEARAPKKLPGRPKGSKSDLKYSHGEMVILGWVGHKLSANEAKKFPKRYGEYFRYDLPGNAEYLLKLMRKARRYRAGLVARCPEAWREFWDRVTQSHKKKTDI